MLPEIPVPRASPATLERNERRPTHPLANDARCLLCHAPLAPDAQDGVNYSNARDTIMDPANPESEDAGLQPVGPECIRRVPAPYRIPAGGG